jgi:hypothetical protein
LSAAHVECTVVNKHAAEIVNAFIAVDFPTTHVECTAVNKHAASEGGFISGDFSAVHGKDAI